MSVTNIVDCILPNSIVVPLACSQDIQLSSLKKHLWQEAKTYPLYSSLRSLDEYLFVGVTVDTKQEEFWDETRRLCDLNLFSPLLKLLESKRTREEKNLDHKIGLALGRDLGDLDRAKDEELQSFRKFVLVTVSEAVKTRQQKGMESLILYHYPPELEPTPHLPQCVKTLLENGMLMVNIWQGISRFITVKVSWDIYPDGIISEALKCITEHDARKDAMYLKQPGGYALQINGTNEYLLANRPVTQYKTLRRQIGQGKTLQLSLIPLEQIYLSLNEFSITYPSSTSKMERLVASDQKPLSLWHPSMEGRLKIHILRAFRVTQRNFSKFFVRVGLFLGTEQLCPVLETQAVGTPPFRWGEWLQLELPIQEVPRAATLCFAICSRSQSAEKKKKRMRVADCMIGWGNLHLFDFENRLIHGNVLVTLHMPSPNFEGQLHPEGSASFPGTPVNSQMMQLGVEFEERFNQPIFFPDEKQIQDYAKYIIKLEKQPTKDSCDEVLEKINDICQRDSCVELTAQEKQFLWMNRELCQQIPDSLPRLIRAVQWSSRDHVCQLYLLLEDWPLLSPETALELMQFTYPDHKVRDHAVTSLSRTLPDEKLAQYLFQLVHTLKHEAYLDSPLLRFLLHKSLTNKNLGYYFFWHLRSEICVWPNQRRALAILEAFCRGLGPELKTLLRHVEMIEKLSKLAEAVKEKRCDSNKERSRHLQRLLQEAEYSSALQHLSSPLRTSLYMGALRVSECRVLDSAHRPLLLVWENRGLLAYHYSTSHELIFKSGDDLRQDMLTLQVISLMTHAWTSEGLDLRMTPYSCLATGNKMGLIEVVPYAKTIYSIQKRAKLGAIQVDSSQLYKWIKDKNKGDRLEQAIETFTRSCAGYCVATFVLGIGDRHPDNIMVNTEGQIFHIDFGHFLGNFKKKFGIQRERVPFVLTLDFLKVIAAGVDNPKESHRFERFQELCGKAYLALRKHSRLIMSLFVLLLSTGLPELQTKDDLLFLRKTLASSATETEALQYFQNQFHEAYGGAWTTKLDWFFHSVKHR